MYTPTETLLQNYANILVNFALNGGKGIKSGDVVQIRIPETAKPLLQPLVKAVLIAGGYPMVDYLPEWWYSKMFFQTASDEQLNWFPDTTMKAKITDADHLIAIIADEDPKELADVPASALMMRQKAGKIYRELRDEKENAGKFTRTLALYPTPAQAAEANMTLEEYRDQVINACFLNEIDPIAKRKEVFAYQESVKEKLNALQIEYLHVQWVDVDLKVKIWAQRKRLWWSGRNIPSFELFISPDWRWTEWRIRFSEPLYQYGKLITGIELHFADGVITSATAEQWQDMLLEMISAENANKIGEFSLTDKRLSRITRFMADTLYDENVGGEYGNTHIAVGNAYKDSYTWDPSTLSKEDRANLWYNESVVHTDIVSTADRTVTAYLADGTSKIIYEDGMFVV